MFCQDNHKLLRCQNIHFISLILLLDLFESISFPRTQPASTAITASLNYWCRIRVSTTMNYDTSSCRPNGTLCCAYTLCHIRCTVTTSWEFLFEGGFGVDSFSLLNISKINTSWQRDSIDTTLLHNPLLTYSPRIRCWGAVTASFLQQSQPSAFRKLNSFRFHCSLRQNDEVYYLRSSITANAADLVPI